jgi:predicted P-loop ATPase
VLKDKDLRLWQAVKGAKSLEELRGITLNVNDAKVLLLIRDALHPAVGGRKDCFKSLNEGALKQIIKNRFSALKQDQEQVLRRRGGGRREWTDDLIRNKAEQIVPNLANAVLILRNSPKWKEVLAFDLFSYRVVIRKSPPWGPAEPGSPWSDHWDNLTMVWFQPQARISPAPGVVGRAVQAAARHNPSHPVTEILESYAWDGRPQLDTYLIKFFHVEDSPYTRAIGSKFVISMVARVFKPGCKVDTMIVLEGPQGRYKSEALRILAIRDEWFTDNLSNIASREAQQEVAGVWLIEIAELEALRRSAISMQKRFLSQRDDRFRQPYGRYVGRVPRQNVFAGTVNPPPGGEGYLLDRTGARGFWPVYCPDVIDLDGLKGAHPNIRRGRASF